MKETDTQGTVDSLSTAEEQDLSIMVNLAKNMLDDGGIDVINSAEKSRDPGQVIGQFLLQLGDQLVEKLSSIVDISPRIMLTPGGWVEQISDYLQETYAIPKSTMDRAEIYIGSMAQQMGDAEQAAPVLPQETTATEAVAPQLAQEMPL